jgi:hypothetical protein
MNVAMRSIIPVLLILATAVACAERSPRPDPEGEPAYSNETPQNPRYERTLEQGEAERMRG